FAARPATNVVAAPVVTAIRAVPPSARSSGRSGPTVRVARREPPAPAPTTQRPDADGGDSLASRHDDGRRRAPDLRITPAPAPRARAARGRRRDAGAACRARARRTGAPASVSHDAPAPPPPPVPTVAGLDA